MDALGRKRLVAMPGGPSRCFAHTIEAGMKMRVIRPAELKRVNSGTPTVETKAIRFSHRCQLYQRMRERLVKASHVLKVLTIKQSYRHVGRRLLMQSSRYMPMPAK